MATTTAIIHPDSGQRTKLARALNRTSAFHCTGLYPDPEAALRAFRCAAPDVVLLDEVFAQPPGSEVVARLRATAPTLQILLLVSGDDLDWVLGAISRGASGCVSQPPSSAH